MSASRAVKRAVSVFLGYVGVVAIAFFICFHHFQNRISPTISTALAEDRAVDTDVNVRRETTDVPTSANLDGESSLKNELPRTPINADQHEPTQVVAQKAAKSLPKRHKPLTQKSKGTIYVVRAPMLTVRSKPDRYSQSIRFLRQGDQVERLDQIDRWFRIGIGEYVSSTYLIKAKTAKTH